MNVQEMHIGIDLELQKINSFSDANIQPEEKDWFLNKEVLKFIEQRTNFNSNTKGTGFHDTTKRIEDLRSLVKKDFKLDILINEEGKKVIFLPSDFYKHVSLNVKSKNNCDNSYTGVNTKTLYKTVFPIIEGDGETVLSSFVIRAIKDIFVTDLFTLSNLPNDYLNSTSFINNQKFMLIKALKIKLKENLEDYINTPFSLYWEKYGEEYYKDSFILITEEDELDSISISVNSNTVSYETEEVVLKDFSTLTPLVSSRVRLLDLEFEDDARFSSLSKSTLNSIIGSLYSNIIELEEPQSIILSSGYLTYICKPDLIDLHLNSDLNMPRKQCEEIVTNTVAFIKVLIESNNYQAYKQENILIE